MYRSHRRQLRQAALAGGAGRASASSSTEAGQTEQVDLVYTYENGDLETLETSEGLNVKFKLRVLADLLKCPLCGGMFRNAVTIRECLHTFCRSCLYRYMFDGGKKCPLSKCDEKLGSLSSDEGLEFDRAVQNLVEKMYPQFLEKENVDMKEMFVFCGLEGKELPLLSSSTSSAAFVSSASLFPALCAMRGADDSWLRFGSQEETVLPSPPPQDGTCFSIPRDPFLPSPIPSSSSPPEPSGRSVEGSSTSPNRNLVESADVLLKLDQAVFAQVFTRALPPEIVLNQDDHHHDHHLDESTSSSTASLSDSATSAAVWVVAKRISLNVPSSTVEQKRFSKIHLALIPIPPFPPMERPFVKTTCLLQVSHITSFVAEQLTWPASAEVELLLEGQAVGRTHTLEFVCRSKKLNPKRCLLFRYRRMDGGGSSAASKSDDGEKVVKPAAISSSFDSAGKAILTRLYGNETTATTTCQAGSTQTATEEDDDVGQSTKSVKKEEADSSAHLHNVHTSSAYSAF